MEPGRSTSPFEPDSQFTSELGVLAKYFHSEAEYTGQTLNKNKRLYWDDKDVLYMGTLFWKQDRQFVPRSNWYKRYAMIHGNYIIIFEEDKKDAKPIEWYCFKKFDSARSVEDKTSSKCEFQMELKSRRSKSAMLRIATSSSDEREMWINCLEAAMDFCQLGKIKRRCKDFLIRELVFQDWPTLGEKSGYVIPAPYCKEFGMFKHELAGQLPRRIISDLAVVFGFSDALTEDLGNPQRDVGRQMVAELERMGIISPTSIAPLEDALEKLEALGIARKVRSSFDRYSTQNTDQTCNDYAYASYPVPRDEYNNTFTGCRYNNSTDGGAWGFTPGVPPTKHTFDESPRASFGEDLPRGRPPTKYHSRDTHVQNPVASSANRYVLQQVPMLRGFHPQSDSNRPENIHKERAIHEISAPIQVEQYKVIADYKKQQKNEVELETGDIVNVFIKRESGWWFVGVQGSHGWAPGSFLAKIDRKEDEEESISGNNKPPKPPSPDPSRGKSPKQ